MGKSRAKAGVMAVGLGSYWAQFPQMRGIIDRAHATVKSLIEPHAEIVSVGVVDNAEASRRAGAKLAASDIDVLFVHLATYANSETLLPAVQRLDVPVILLNVQRDRVLDMENTRDIGDWLAAGVTPASLPEMTNILLRLGMRFDTITGHLDNDPELSAELELWCGIAGLARRLRTQSLGLLGRPFAGMLDLNVDETRLTTQFGTFVRHLDWDDAAAEMRTVSAAEREAAVAELRQTFPASTSLAADEFEAAGTVLAAMLKLVERNNLLAIASHYEGAGSGDRAALLSALNPALSVLNARGIACPVEADMKVAFAMLALKTVAGSATLAELYSMDFNEDVIIIGHSGAGDPAISDAPPRLAMSEVFHGKAGKGYLTQFYPRAGDVTLLSMMQDASGGYRLVAAEGEIVPGPTLQLGDTNARVRFPQGLRRFVREWGALGPTHHGAMGYGRQIDRLSRAAIALNLPMDVVGS